MASRATVEPTGCTRPEQHPMPLNPVLLIEQGTNNVYTANGLAVFGPLSRVTRSRLDGERTTWSCPRTPLLSDLSTPGA